ncbi:MAG TPA: TorF family putative porin [Steroidobacteraceae bacterium]|nr:TorF family putative porin [Steroidobacteraceae bacterium]
MRLKLACAAATLLLAAQGAYAQFSSTVTLTSDYDFRGYSQSAKDPALQGSLDYALPNGFAVGAWASNVDFGDSVDGDIELDLYGNYTGEINDKTSWVAGFVYYLYPGSDASATKVAIGEYPEYYAGINAGPLSFKQWYSNDLYELDEDGWYTEGNATIELPQSFLLLLHAGYSWGDYWDLAGGEIFDYSVGVGYAIKNFSLNLKLTGTDASGAQQITSDAANNEDRVIFSVATTLPWGE